MKLKAPILCLLMTGATQAGDIGQYGRSLELRNWLVNNEVKITDSVEIFLGLTDIVPISDTSGLIKPDAIFRTTNTDKSKGWINRVIRRLHVAENSHKPYWIYHIETYLIFDLTKKK